MKSKIKANYKILLIALGIILAIVLGIISNYNRKNATVYYKTYTKENGWTHYSKNGKTNGKDNDIKAIQFDVKYQNSGFVVSKILVNGVWSENVFSDEVNGNKEKNITAIKLALTDNLYHKNNICYRVHNSKNKWLGWACNGQEAGTIDTAIDKIEVKILSKDKKYTEELKDYDSKIKSYIENIEE